MTQQQMSKLLDIPERTLRDWKSGRSRLYTLLQNIEYEDAKDKINVVDIDDIIEFEPSQYSQNMFWQTKEKSQQKVYAIISNYLSTINIHDIKELCNQFGKNMVKSVLSDKYKEMYKKGFISTSGMDIPLHGKYNENPTFKQLSGIINDF
ncbi:helix-turn-helix domain-containing protein [Arcobacter sp.]|uniref:helix-turn-helix domain-containing protein n=1 Tax=unclassified Arcobacter TaxID=2593671 RepID=UPI003AFF87D1